MNLPLWRDFTELMRNSPCNEDIIITMGFKGSRGDINRTNARYRLAREIKNIEYHSYHENTAYGYTVLIKAFLTYSAYEQYVRAIDPALKSQKEIVNFSETLFGKTALDISNELQELDPNLSFFNYIDQELSEKSNLKHDIQNLLRENKANPVVLLCAVRHIFVHGKLTIWAKESNAKANASILDDIVERVLGLIADSFEKKVSEYRAN